MDKDYEGGVFPTMKNDSAGRLPEGKTRKLHYMIHNPNTVEETTKVLLTVFLQVNERKVERKLRELVPVSLQDKNF